DDDVLSGVVTQDSGLVNASVGEGDNIGLWLIIEGIPDNCLRGACGGIWFKGIFG
ncbi:11051_t:CDS:1, partial [Dentiscutata heterogama]